MADKKTKKEEPKQAEITEEKKEVEELPKWMQGPPKTGRYAMPTVHVQRCGAMGTNSAKPNLVTRG